MGYFSCPSVLRAMDLAPRAIDTPVVEADLLYPRAGRPREEIAYAAEDLSASFPGPLPADAALHPDFRE
jgi:hypothetical protein